MQCMCGGVDGVIGWVFRWVSGGGGGRGGGSYGVLLTFIKLSVIESYNIVSH